jgi:hypothetical protein
MTSKAFAKLVAAFLFALFVLAIPARAQNARLDVHQLDRLAAAAKETVEVTMDRPSVQLLAKLMTMSEPKRSKFAELAARLQGIYVRGYEFEREGEFSESDVEAIRVQLRAPGWQRIVQVRERDGGNNEVYFMPREEVVEGLAIISTEPKCLCVINVVGALSLDEFGLLDREFGITKCGMRSDRQRARTPQRIR